MNYIFLRTWHFIVTGYFYFPVIIQLLLHWSFTSLILQISNFLHFFFSEKNLELHFSTPNNLWNSATVAFAYLMHKSPLQNPKCLSHDQFRLSQKRCFCKRDQQIVKLRAEVGFLPFRACVLLCKNWEQFSSFWCFILYLITFFLFFEITKLHREVKLIYQYAIIECSIGW